MKFNLLISSLLLVSTLSVGMISASENRYRYSVYPLAEKPYLRLDIESVSKLSVEDLVAIKTLVVPDLSEF